MLPQSHTQPLDAVLLPILQPQQIGIRVVLVSGQTKISYKALDRVITKAIYIFHAELNVHLACMQIFINIYR
jgi:hypothetical protein